jgi:hypothetical protein
VLPASPMPLIVDNVRVLVPMQQLLVSMRHDSSLSRRNATIVCCVRIPRQGRWSPLRTDPPEA